MFKCNIMVIINHGTSFHRNNSRDKVFKMTTMANKAHYDCFTDCVATICMNSDIPYEYYFMNKLCFDFTDKGATIADRIDSYAKKLDRYRLSRDYIMDVHRYQKDECVSVLQSQPIGSYSIPRVEVRDCPWFPPNIQVNLSHYFIVRKTDTNKYMMIDPFFGFFDDEAYLCENDFKRFTESLYTVDIKKVKPQEFSDINDDVLHYLYLYSNPKITDRYGKLCKIIENADMTKEFNANFSFHHEIPIVRKIKDLYDGRMQFSEFISKYSEDFDLSLNDICSGFVEVGNMWKKEYVLFLMQFSGKGFCRSNVKTANSIRNISVKEEELVDRLTEILSSSLSKVC